MMESHCKAAQHSYLFDWPDAVVVISGLTGYIGAYPSEAAAVLTAAYRDPSRITPAFRERFPELFAQLVFLPVNVDESRVVAEILRKSRFKRKKPAFVLQLTELCNLYCKYCYQEKRPKFMSAAMAERAIAYILNHADAADHLTVTYFGGEPLLAFERMRQIHTAVLSARPSARFTIITNGTRFDEAMAFFFQATKKLGSVQLTIDGDREHHDVLRCHRNGTGSYDEIRRALPALAQSCENLSVRVNVTADNRDSIPNLLRDLDEISTHHSLNNIHVYLARATPYGGYQVGEFTPANFDDFRSLRVEFAGMPSQVHRRSRLSRTCSLVGASCAAPYVEPAWIDTEGYLYDCQHLCGSPAKSVGHINDRAPAVGSGPLASEKLFFENLPHCAACRHKLFCGGPCPLQLADGITRTELCDEGFAVLLRARLDQMLGRTPTPPPRRSAATRCADHTGNCTQLRPITVADIAQTTSALHSNL